MAIHTILAAGTRYTLVGTRRVNHSVAFLDEGVCTNQAESYFSRLRRAEIGTHHHIAWPTSQISESASLQTLW